MEQVNIQLAAFFDNDYTGGFDKILTSIKSVLGDPKRTPQLLPIPESAPSEIPRLVMEYENFQINVSKNRADIFSDNFENIDNHIKNVCKSISEITRIGFERVGFINTFIEESSAQKIFNLIRKDDIVIEKIKEAGLRINLRQFIETYECNDIEEISYGEITKKKANNSSEKLNGILIKRDINNISCQDTVFNHDEVYKLAKKFHKESCNFILYGDE